MKPTSSLGTQTQLRYVFFNLNSTQTQLKGTQKKLPVAIQPHIKNNNRKSTWNQFD